MENSTKTLSGLCVVKPGEMQETPIYPKRNYEQEQNRILALVAAIVVTSLLVWPWIDKFFP